MRATTEINMGVMHIGVKGAKAEIWSGTFAHCVTQLAQYLGKISMATRFDIVIARNEEECRKALGDRARKNVIHPDDFDLSNLERLMDQESSTELSSENRIPMITVTAVSNRRCMHDKAANEHCVECGR